MRRTVITGFSGGGLADKGYQLAGYEMIGAVEYIPAIADVYRANIGPHIRVESVMDTDWRTFDRPDLLHFSPECKEFSQAKSNGAEGPIQRAQAEAICRALETLTPPTFVLENVVGYRRSQSLARIVATLDRLGYMTDIQHCNAADFGVPQTRRRLIVRAVRGGLVPHLPPPVPWVGWYAAIADLIPTLPESAFAPWQLARLEPLFGHTLVPGGNSKNEVFALRLSADPAITVTQHAHPRAFLVSPGSDSTRMVATMRDQDDPAMTTTPGADGRMRAFLAHPNADNPRFPAPVGECPSFTVGTFQGGLPRAFIVDGKANSDGETVTVRGDGEPCFTIAAHAGKQASRAWLEQGRVVAMTPRALARFQSVPDDYLLPESRTLACTVIGNGVPSLLAQAIGESLGGVA